MKTFWKHFKNLLKFFFKLFSKKPFENFLKNFWNNFENIWKNLKSFWKLFFLHFRDFCKHFETIFKHFESFFKTFFKKIKTFLNVFEKIFKILWKRGCTLTSFQPIEDAFAPASAPALGPGGVPSGVLKIPSGLQRSGRKSPQKNRISYTNMSSKIIAI